MSFEADCIIKESRMNNHTNELRLHQSASKIDLRREEIKIIVKTFVIEKHIQKPAPWNTALDITMLEHVKNRFANP